MWRRTTVVAKIIAVERLIEIDRLVAVDFGSGNRLMANIAQRLARRAANG